MGTSSRATNKDLLNVMHDLMQMASDGFVRLEGRMDKLENRMDRFEARLGSIEHELVDIKSRLAEHDITIGDLARQVSRLTLAVEELIGNGKAYISDIKDILDRLSSLEKRLPNLTQHEYDELRRKLHVVAAWALKVAKKTDVPLRVR